MTPSDAIDALDRALAAAGTPVTLSRRVNGRIVSVDCQAKVTAYQLHELVGPIIQGDSKAILSPTEIVAAGWPAPQSASGPDVRVPVKGDVLLLGGLPRTVQAASPIYLAGELIRLNLQVRG